MEKTDNSYIAIDLETTGLNPKTERIIEIGAARVEDGIVVQTYSTFVNPERELDARIRELTGICDDDLKDAPVLDTVLPELLAFCGSCRFWGIMLSLISAFSSGRRSTGSIHLSMRGLIPENLPPFYAGGGKELAAACRYFSVDRARPSGAFGWLAAHHLYQELKTGIFWKCWRCLHRSL